MVITIGREFGSGGKYIGERLSQELGMKLYDKEILDKVSEEAGIDLDVLKEMDEKQEQSFWYTYAMDLYHTDESLTTLSDLPSNELVFIEQSKVIEELANTEDCIIIGRCSNVILENNPNALNVFIYSSNLDFKIQRKLKYGDLKDEVELIKLIQNTDNERAHYYNYFTHKEWGNRNDFDLMIDTSKIGVDGAVELIKRYVELKKNQ